MSNLFIEYLPYILELNDSKLSEIGISMFKSDGSIRSVIEILEDLWTKNIEEIVKNDYG